MACAADSLADLKGNKFKLRNLFAQPADEVAFAKFLRQKGLLKSDAICDACGSGMRLCPPRGNHKESFQCPKWDCRREKEYRYKSFFESSNMEPRKIFEFVYM